jgi:hypothetical protein
LFIGFFALQSAAGDKKQSHVRLGLVLLLLAYVLLWAGFFPSFVAWGTRPPDRAIFVPMFIFVWVVVLLGVFVGQRLSSIFAAGARRNGWQGVVFVLVFLSLVWMQVRTASAAAQLVPSLQAYVQLWDARDQFLRQAALQHKGAVVIPSLRRDPALRGLPSTSIWMLGELEETPHFWVNQAAADYYGLKSISGK